MLLSLDTNSLALLTPLALSLLFAPREVFLVLPPDRALDAPRELFALLRALPRAEYGTPPFPSFSLSSSRDAPDEGFRNGFRQSLEQTDGELGDV